MEDLIAGLSREIRTGTAMARPARQALRAGVVGLLVAAVFVFAGLGVRADIPGALLLLHPAVKLLAPLAVGLAGALWLAGLLRPDPAMARGFALPAAFALFAIPSAAGLGSIASWSGPVALAGPGLCVGLVGVTSAPILALILLQARSAPVTAPISAGLAAGLCAGGFGAAVYSLHCTMDGLAYVSGWYPLAILAVGAAGALAGRSMRWWQPSPA
jgi:hypothetical protein